MRRERTGVMEAHGDTHPYRQTINTPRGKAVEGVRMVEGPLRRGAEGKSIFVYVGENW